jgi:hypothetical protein
MWTGCVPLPEYIVGMDIMSREYISYLVLLIWNNIEHIVHKKIDYHVNQWHVSRAKLLHITALCDTW